MTNSRRAKAAELGLSEFTFTTYGRRYAYQLPAEEREQAVSDLINGLMHYCDREGFDFSAAISLAKRHYKVEATYDWDEQTELDPKSNKERKTSV